MARRVKVDEEQYILMEQAGIIVDRSVRPLIPHLQSCDSGGACIDAAIYLEFVRVHTAAAWRCLVQGDQHARPAQVLQMDARPRADPSSTRQRQVGQ